MIEFHAGYRGDETPRAVVIGGTRFGIVGILSRERALDRSSGRTREVWRCRLDDGRIAKVELLEDGARRVDL